MVSRQFFKFSLVGVAGFIVDSIVLYCAIWLGLGHYFGRACSYLFAATSTWWMNRRFTFPNASSGRLIHQWAKFLLLNAIGGLVNYSVYGFLISQIQFFFDYPVFAVAIGSLSGLIFNFSGSRAFVFKLNA